MLKNRIKQDHCSNKNLNTKKDKIKYDLFLKEGVELQQPWIKANTYHNTPFVMVELDSFDNLIIFYQYCL